MGAPTAKLETVVVVSPLKVLSVSSAGVAVLFLLVSIPTSFWIHGDSTTRYGIWKNCEFTEADNETINCYVTNKVWIQISGSLILACIACSAAGIGLVLAGFKHQERQERKLKFYQTAGVVFLIGIISIVLALIIFPTMLQGELEKRGKENWYFGWSYGLAWGATIFLAAALGLLVYDRNKEEVFYKEKLYLNQEEDEENRMVDQEAKIKTLN